MQYVAIPNPDLSRRSQTQAETALDHFSAVESPRPTSPTSPKRPTNPSDEKYSLKKGHGFWQLTFAGRHAVFKHEQGAFYVAYLLDHPNEPIHGLALAMRATLAAGKSNGATRITNPETGETVTVEIDAAIHQRSLGLDDAEAEWSLRRKQLELEAIVDDESTTEPMREEANRDLEAIYNHQKKNPWATRTTAQKTADSVARAIKRLHKHLAESADGSGKPNKVLRAFADHIKQHILIPSGRNFGRDCVRPTERIGGFFTYESRGNNS